MKKLLILGGSQYALPLIKTAHELGIFVITCDYLKDNIAHRYSDIYINESVTNKRGILKIAKRFKINGITSFACDPGVETMAFVTNKLKLPSVGPYKSVHILQNKNLFRKFLKKHGFNTPFYKCVSTKGDLMKVAKTLKYPLIIKPVDSAGSKGVSKIETPNEIYNAFALAKNNSRSKKVIVEEFLKSVDNPSDSDCYSYKGKLEFVSFSNQYFDLKSENPYTPAGFIWPSSMELLKQKEIELELQRLLTLLKMNTSIYNVESRYCTNGKTYLMEVSPRGGGNRICEMINLSYGIDLIKRHVMDCVGINNNEGFQLRQSSRICEIILHSNEGGTFYNVEIDQNGTATLLEKNIWVKQGDHIDKFCGANKAFGTVIFKIDDKCTYQDICNKIKVINQQ